MFDTQRCRWRRSDVQVHTLEVPDALPVQLAGAAAHVSSAPTAFSTHPFAHASDCTMLVTQRCR
jgi:hypothetical protein